MSEYYLYYTSWEEIPSDMRLPFIGMLSGNANRAKDFYQLYFYWFNIPHEIAHILRLKYGTSQIGAGNFYQEEQAVNDFAVGYWRFNHHERKLQTLSQLIDEAISNLPNPVPTDASPQTFFNENYSELGKQPAYYGYFQLSFVKNSMNNKKDFVEILRTCIFPKITIPNQQIKQDYGEIDVNLPVKVVEDLHKTLETFGIVAPAINVIKEYYPMLQFVCTEEEREELKKMAQDTQSPK